MVRCKQCGAMVQDSHAIPLWTEDGFICEACDSKRPFPNIDLKGAAIASGEFPVHYVADKLGALIMERDKLRAELNAVEKQIRELRGIVFDAIGEPEREHELQGEWYVVRILKQEQKRIDVKAFRKAHPELAREFEVIVVAYKLTAQPLTAVPQEPSQ